MERFKSDHACAVIIGRWWKPEDKIFTFYARNHRGDTRGEYWAHELLQKVTKDPFFKGNVKDYSIFLAKNSEKYGSPIYRNIF